MDGIAGLQGWRWIFILEGILTVVVAIFAYFLIYDFPETAPFLTEREREFVIHRLKYQGSSAGAKKVAQHEGFDWKYVRDAFTDWQIYLSLFSKSSLQRDRRRKVRLIIFSVYWGITCPLYGISLFLPTIIKDLGYTSSVAQLLTVRNPPQTKHEKYFNVLTMTLTIGSHLRHRSRSCSFRCILFRS